MEDKVQVKPIRSRFKKGFIVALFLGIAMVYFPYFYSMIEYGRFIFNALVLAEIAVIISAVLLLNKNIKIALALLVAYIALIFINHPLNSLLPFLDGGRGYNYFDYKYTNGYFIFSARIIEFVLVAVTLYGLNKAIKAISIISSVLLLVLESIWLFSSRIYISSSSEYGMIFLYAAYYSELLLPLVLFLCAIKPRYIHGSIKVIDSYMAVRLLLFAAGDLLYALKSDSFRYLDHLNIMYLINISWMPLITIFGLNAVLLFPIRFKELAKVFGWSALVIGLVFAASAAQQSIDDNKNKSEVDREAYMNELRDNIQSWEDAGFSEGFTRDAARSMLNEGRITQKEYEWLIRELVR